MIYSLTAIVFFLLSIFLWRESSFKKMRLALIASMVWLTLYEGLRWEIGTDWDGYYDAFRYEDNPHMGITYNFIIYCFKSISTNYTLFIVLLSSISYFALYNLLKHSPQPLITLCIYYCGMLGIMGSNRQLLAIAVCFLSLNFIFKRKLLLYIVSILFATTIHITALSFLPAYFLFNYTYGKRQVVFVMGGVILIGLMKLTNHIPFIEYLSIIDGMGTGTGLTGYVEYNPGLSVSILGTIKRVIFVYLAMSVKGIINDQKYNFFLLLYIIGCCIYILFNGSVLQMVAGRGSAYYGVFECVVMTYFFSYVSADFLKKEILWAFFFVFYLSMMWRDIHNYIILEGVDIFNPYKSVFSI